MTLRTNFSLTAGLAAIVLMCGCGEGSRAAPDEQAAIAPLAITTTGGPIWEQATVPADFDRAAAAEQIDSILQAQADVATRSYRLWKRGLQGEDTAAERAALKLPEQPEGLKDDALRVVKADPTDEAALRAMVLVASSRYGQPDAETDAPAANPQAQLHAHLRQLILAYHLQHPDALKAIARLYADDAGTVAFWQRVHDESSNLQMRGNAAAMLMEHYFTRLQDPDRSELGRKELREQGMAYAQEIKDSYADVRTGPGLRLPRYMDQETATLGEFVANRETVLAHSVGERLPSIEVSDLQGNTDALEKYRGRILLVDFWATWCGPCKAGHPDLVALDKEMAGKPFEIIGISVDDKPADVVKYMKQQLNLPWVQWHIGPTGQLLADWGVQGFPTYLVVDAEGVVHERTNHLNEGSKAMIRTLVAQLEDQAQG